MNRHKALLLRVARNNEAGERHIAEAEKNLADARASLERGRTFYGEIGGIIDSFDYELCAGCGNDLDDHTIDEDPLGHAHIFCLYPTAPLDADDALTCLLRAHGLLNYEAAAMLDARRDDRVFVIRDFQLIPSHRLTHVNYQVRVVRQDVQGVICYTIRKPG